MFRRSSSLIAALALVLLTGCVAAPTRTRTPVPETGQGGSAPTSATACPTEAACPDRLHVVSPYSTLEDLTEATAALHDYAITVQEFDPDGLSEALPPASAAFRPADVLPVAALGRPVDDTATPPPLPAAAEVTPWRLYIRGAPERTEIGCAAAAGLVWQEVYAILKPVRLGRNANTYAVPITEVCYMPPGATSEVVGAHADAASIWLDVAVFERGDGTFGLYRFGPPDPGAPGGGAACKTVSAPIHCNSTIGCFVEWLCQQVC